MPLGFPGDISALKRLILAECLGKDDSSPEVLSGLQCVASEIYYFYWVERFLRAISVNERSKSDGSDDFHLRGTTQ